nr:hypothetical protein [Deltaproteobacteria bacterium]
MRLLYPVMLVGCGFSGTPAPATGDGALPDGESAIDAMVDAKVSDATIPPDALVCFGTGFGAVCLPAAPSTPLALPATAAFDTGGGGCTHVVTLGGTAMCVLAGTTVTLAAATTFRAIGPRPLIIVASQTMAINGSLSVSSLRGAGTGAGAATVVC